MRLDHDTIDTIADLIGHLFVSPAAFFLLGVAFAVGAIERGWL